MDDGSAPLAEGSPSNPPPSLSPADSAADVSRTLTTGNGGPGCAASPQIYGNLKPLWSKTLGIGYTAAVATDSANNVVVAGSTIGSVTIDGQSFPPVDAGTGLLSPFVFELDPTGQLRWHREFGVDDIDITATAVDSSGNVFITGDISPFLTTPPDLGTGPLVGSFFLAKFTSQGQTLWAIAAQCGAANNEAIAVDPSGNVVVVGNSADPACFGGVPADASAASGGAPAFVAVYDATGHGRYSKVFVAGAPRPSVQFDPSGNLFVVGGFSDSLALGPPLAAPSGSAAFVAKLDSTGQLLWQVADGSYASASALATSPAGAIIAGTFHTTIGLTAPVAARGPADLFLLHMDENGTPAFEKTIPAAGLQPDVLATDPTGGVVMVGELGSYADLGGGQLAPSGVVVAKFDSSGNHVYSARFAVDPYTNSLPRSPTLAVDTGGNVVLGGGFYGSAADLGTGVLPTADPNDPNRNATLFVARYAPDVPQLASPRAACPVPTTDAGLPEGGSLLATSVGTSRAADIAVSADAVYWTTGAEVMRVPIAGGDAVPVATMQNGAEALVLDSNSLYWTNRGTLTGASPPQDGSIVSLALDGGTTTTLVSGQDAPGALAVDDTSVYYFAGETFNASLFSVPRTGGTLTPVANGLVSQGPVAVYGGVLAFATASSGAIPTPWQVFTVPASGGSPTMLATSDHTVASIAIDAVNVYWLDASTNPTNHPSADGRVRSVSRQGGGSAVLLADNQAAPGKLVLLGPTLFWSTQGSSMKPAGAGLWSLPSNGGSPTGLVTNRLGVATFAVDATHIAWFDLLNGETGLLGLFVGVR